MAEGVAELVRRAEVDAGSGERRYVYSGDPTHGVGPRARPNRRGVVRKVSTFNILALLFAAGVTAVAYVSNIITVKQLALEISQLQARYEKTVNANAVLRADIDRKTGWEQIGARAVRELGLRYPSRQAEWFDVDEELAEKAAER